MKAFQPRQPRCGFNWVSDFGMARADAFANSLAKAQDTARRGGGWVMPTAHQKPDTASKV